MSVSKLIIFTAANIIFRWGGGVKVFAKQSILNDHKDDSNFS